MKHRNTSVRWVQLPPRATSGAGGTCYRTDAFRGKGGERERQHKLKAGMYVGVYQCLTRVCDDKLHHIANLTKKVLVQLAM